MSGMAAALLHDITFYSLILFGIFFLNLAATENCGKEYSVVAQPKEERKARDENFKIWVSFEEIFNNTHELKNKVAVCRKAKSTTVIFLNIYSVRNN